MGTRQIKSCVSRAFSSPKPEKRKGSGDKNVSRATSFLGHQAPPAKRDRRRRLWDAKGAHFGTVGHFEKGRLDTRCFYFISNNFISNNSHVHVNTSQTQCASFLVPFKAPITPVSGQATFGAIFVAISPLRLLCRVRVVTTIADKTVETFYQINTFF